MTAKEIRDSFKSFFESKGHQVSHRLMVISMTPH